jgi:hypothetical protein
MSYALFEVKAIKVKTTAFKEHTKEQNVLLLDK